MTALRVGLTGGLASGKSTVARMLAEAGCRVVDADELVADLYAPGGAGASQVRQLFGREFLDEKGGVDHQRLAAEVFADDEARARLEAAIHPLVGRLFERIADADNGIVVLEATLLVEAGFSERFDLVVTVEAHPSIRLERAVERGLSFEEASARLAAQGEGDERRAAADVEIRNEGTLEDLEEKVRVLLLDLRRRLAEKTPAGELD